MGRKVVVHGGVLGMEDGPVQADLVIDGERISAITLDARDVPADERIDATGLFVVPGGIDVHTHFREPAPVLLEGFHTGSQAAVAGGVTTVVEMPQASPVSSEGAHIRQKAQIGSQESIVDFALWGAAANQDLDRISEMLDEGVVGIKSFMAGSSPGMPAVSDAYLMAVLEHLAETGVPYGLHAENDALLQDGIARMKAAGRNDILAHAASRPPYVEVEAINRALFFAELTGGYVYVVHVSTGEGFELVRAARERGVRVHAETCPQYLVFDEDDLPPLGPFGRCAPPFRSRDQVEAVWDFVVDGTVDVISSDHAGYTIESKEQGREIIWDAPNGLTGIQTMFPSVLDEMMHHRALGLEDFVRLTAANPARIFSLFPRKGIIQVGSDADLALYDPDESWTVRAADMLYRHKWTPMEGKEIQSRVVRTIVRGRTVYRHDGGHVVSDEKGTGKFLRRGYGTREDA